MKVEVTLHGVDGVLATLASLPAEIVSKRGGPVKTALRKGAVVIRKAEQANLRSVTSNATASGKRESIGLLIKSLTVRRGKPPTGEKGERYIVSVKKRIYPDREGKPVNTQQTAAWLEYGSRGGEQPAEPWIRPAVITKGAEAIQTIKRELLKEIDKVVAKLAAQNKGR